MKIIFLDFDGVLKNGRSFRVLKSCAAPECVRHLNFIVAQTDASIVVSSTWREIGLTKCRDLLSGWGVKALALDATPILRKMVNGLHIAEMRGAEIQSWLDQSKDHPESFVILDDDDEMLHLKKYHVKTEFETGLTLADAHRAIAVLNSPQKH